MIFKFEDTFSALQHHILKIHFLTITEKFSSIVEKIDLCEYEYDKRVAVLRGESPELCS